MFVFKAVTLVYETITFMLVQVNDVSVDAPIKTQIDYFSLIGRHFDILVQPLSVINPRNHFLAVRFVNKKTSKQTQSS